MHVAGLGLFAARWSKKKGTIPMERAGPGDASRGTLRLRSRGFALAREPPRDGRGRARAAGGAPPPAPRPVPPVREDIDGFAD
jgi:hypothetical protein